MHANFSTKKNTINNSTAFFTLLLIAAGACLPCAFLQAQNNYAPGLTNKSNTMAERWELGKQNHKGFFIITPYRPVYVTAGRWSSSPNTKPTSENPLYTLPFKVNYNNYEAKFQLSFKTKISSGLFWGNGDIWVAYTQKAHWQLYNEKLSRPFRELNYEPELILNFATDYTLCGIKGRMVGILFNHQSNGKTLPLSRSWNRIIAQAGFEKNNWQMILKVWHRLKDEVDENPAIANYVGRSEATIIYNAGKCQFSSVLTHSLKFKNGGRGSMQLNWVFPVVSNLRAQLQVSEGNGETMLDYNHRQATIGISVSLVDW